MRSFETPSSVASRRCPRSTTSGDSELWRTRKYLNVQPIISWACRKGQEAQSSSNSDDKQIRINNRYQFKMDEKYENINRNAGKFCCTELPQDAAAMPNRRIVTNRPDLEVCSNKIKTTSSNFVTFVPLNLIKQLSQPVNLYFLIVAMMETVKPISNTGGKPTGLLPLCFVLSTVLIKDAFEQFYRYRKDSEENQRKVAVLKQGHFSIMSWQELYIGDIIRLNSKDLLPCDVVLLKTSDSNGRAFVETKNLDGEANLKVKRIPYTKSVIPTLSDKELNEELIELKYQRPDKNLYRFEGTVKIRDKQWPLTNANLLMKGSSVQIVHEVVGVCVYTGRDTKLSLNSTKFQQKVSYLTKSLNKIVIVILIMQVLLSTICALMNLLFEGSRIKELGEVRDSYFWTQVGVWWMIMTYVVPISLVVTMEMVKTLQVLYMTKDERLRSSMSDCLPSWNSSAVNENLGQIKYIFSDKTGTLTANDMRFKKLILNGRVYGNDQTVDSTQQNRFPVVQNVDFKDANFFEANNREFLQCLALCHDAMLSKTPSGKEQYSSSSPDQIAFVNFSKYAGIEFIGDMHNKRLVFDRKTGKQLKFILHASLEFNSKRSRMSVVVENEKSEITLYTKGADSKIKKLLSKNAKNATQTYQYLDEFAREGLRTLVIAKRDIPAQQFKLWIKNYEAANLSLTDRDRLINVCYDQIQVDLELLGATGVEDRLQQNVKETIQHIMDSGITFYILTGDKRQTAINIANSCGMLREDTVLISPPIEFEQIENLEERQEKHIKWIKAHTPFQPNSVFLLDASLMLPQIPLHSSICYRCIPEKKSNIVKSVKSQSDQLTLAIGDGSNDVNMLNAADVGIGIKGKEGNQVCRIADFVIGQFSILEPLVFYYGREWYRRNAKLVNYNYFKNIYHVFSVIGYGTWSFFSGIVLFESILYECLNVFFATIPIIVFAVLDEEYDLKESLENPRLYSKGQNSEYFNQWTYWKTILLGTLFGICSEAIMFYNIEGRILNSDGRIGYFTETGLVLYFNIIFVINMKVLLMSHGHTPLLIFSVFGTFAWYWGTYAVIMRFFDHEIEASLRTQWNTPFYYVLNTLVGCTILLIDYATKQYFTFEKRTQLHRATKKL